MAVGWGEHGKRDQQTLCSLYHYTSVISFMWDWWSSPWRLRTLPLGSKWLSKNLESRNFQGCFTRWIYSVSDKTTALKPGWMILIFLEWTLLLKMQTPVPSKPLFLHSYSNSHSDSQIKFYCEQMFNHSKSAGTVVLTCIQPEQAACMSSLHLRTAALEHAGRHIFTEALGKRKIRKYLSPHL